MCKWAGWLYGWVVWVGLQKLITFLGGWEGAEMVSSTVMYNFGGGPRGDPLFTAF